MLDLIREMQRIPDEPGGMGHPHAVRVVGTRIVVATGDAPGMNRTCARGSGSACSSAQR
jgi:hypothetical protein